MNVINQTNKTIVFEEFNQEVDNILTIIGDVENIGSLDDEKIKEINEKLVVSSFEEFIFKFKPCIYSYMDVNDKKIVYTLNKNPSIPDSMYKEIPINVNNPFVKMLITLLENRKNIDLKNMDFNFEDILELISPKKIINDIKQLRKEINYLFNKYENLTETNPKKLELGDKLNEKFYEASSNYNNVLAMLPLAIEDIKTKLAIGENKVNSNVDLIKLGYLEFSEKGELEFKESFFEKNKEIMLPDNSKKLSLIFKEDYYDNSENPQEYVSSLITRTFVPITTSNLEIDFEKEVTNYNQYLQIYQKSQEDFINSCRALIEKIMGIKIFFEQYNTKSGIMKPKLLITNVSNEVLLSPKQKIKIEKYLNTVNGKNDYDNTIWLGIFPNVSLIKEIDSGKKRLFKGNQDIKNTELNTIEGLASLLEVTSKYKVEMFFSFIRSSDTTFDNLSTVGINKYIEKTKILESQKYSEYAIPCIPNFTLIPKDKSGIKLDKRALFEDNKVIYSKEDDFEFFIEGIYVDSAYVAAGIVAAYQCPGYLRERYKNVSNDNPGIRFNIEQDDNSLYVRTTLAREITGYTNDIKDEINRDNYGFVFSSESGHLNNEKIVNATVYKARSLYKGNNYVYEPIYKTMTSTYIERVLRYMTQDFKEDKLNNFFSNSPNSQKTIWFKENKNVNSILKSGDDITHFIDEENNSCQLNLVFSGETKNLKIEINKNE